MVLFWVRLGGLACFPSPLDRNRAEFEKVRPKASKDERRASADALVAALND